MGHDFKEQDDAAVALVRGYAGRERCAFVIHCDANGSNARLIGLALAPAEQARLLVRVVDQILGGPERRIIVGNDTSELERIQ